MLKYLLVLLFSFVFLDVVQSQWIEQEIPPGFDFNLSLIDSNDDIFVYGINGVFVSYDHGENFIKTTGLPDVITYARLIELDDKTVLFRSHHDLYKFDKAINTWVIYIKAQYQLANIDQSGRAWYYVNANGKCYYTDDLGKNYTVFNNKIGNISSTTDIFGKFKPDFNLQFYEQSPREVRKIKDNGDVEVLFKFKNSPKAYMYVNPNSGTLFLTCGGGFCRTTDGINLDTSIFSTSYKPSDFKEVRILKDLSLLLKTDRGFYTSKDDGINWEPLIPAWYFNGILDAKVPESIGFVSSEDTIVAFKKGCKSQGFYKSVDFGETWIKKGNKKFSGTLSKIEEDKLGNQYALSCSDTTAFIKKYNEIEWSKLEVNYLGKKYGIYDFTVNQKNEIYVATKYGIFLSKDFGKMFKLLNIKINSSQTYKIILSNVGFIYLIGSNNTSYVSSDNGLKWKSLNIEIETNYAINVDPLGNLYYTGPYPIGVNVWTYGLKSYRYVEDSITLLKDSSSCNIIIRPNGLIYFIKYINQQKVLCVSTDGLKSYKIVNDNKDLSNMLCYLFFNDINGSLYIGNNKAIYKSDDEGRTFYYWNAYPQGSGFLNLSQNQILFRYDDKLNKLYRLNTKVTSGTLVQGSTFDDIDKDCIWGNPEKISPITLVEISGTKPSQIISDKSGEYKCRIEEGDYTFSSVAPNKLYEACSIPVSVTPQNQNDTLHADIGLKIKEYCPYLTVQVQNSIARRCFDNTIYVHYQNDGTATANNVDLKITLDNYFEYLSSTISPTSQAGKELTFNISQVLPGESGDIIIYTNLSCDASNGETVCINAQFNPENKCNTILPKLDNYTKCDTVTGSYDPNNKRAFVNGSPSNGIVDMNQDIEYLIRFQNTGTDTAFRVVVTDQIAENFDLSSIKILNYSHPVKIKIDEPRKVSFIFDDIMLPDSNINEAASHGFISFKISPKKDLPYGTTLNNYADIFFDYNDPIRTDTAYLVVDKETSVSTTESLDFRYYPNPTNENLNIYVENNKEGSYKLKVLNILGKVQYQADFNGSYYNLKSCKAFGPGIYLLHLEDKHGRFKTASFIVE